MDLNFGQLVKLVQKLGNIKKLHLKKLTFSLNNFETQNVITQKQRNSTKQKTHLSAKINNADLLDILRAITTSNQFRVYVITLKDT